jgi:hypothetical protein
MLYTDTELTSNNVRHYNYSIEIVQIVGSESIKTLYTNSKTKSEAIKFGHEYALRIAHLFPHSYVLSVTKLEKEGK